LRNPDKQQVGWKVGRGPRTRSSWRKREVGLKKTYRARRQGLRRRGGGYAHAKQFKSGLRRVLKPSEAQDWDGLLAAYIETQASRLRERTAGTKLAASGLEAGLAPLPPPFQRQAQASTHCMRLNVECIGERKGNASPYEFGVKGEPRDSTVRATRVDRSVPGVPGKPLWTGHTGWAERATRNRASILLAGTWPGPAGRPEDYWVDLGVSRRGRLEIISTPDFNSWNNHKPT